MDRVADPLTRMGATVTGAGGRCLPPLTVTGGALHGIDYTPPMASAQVEGAVLLAGLAAEGETVVREPVATRAHTEEMLAEAGADVTVEATGAGRVVRLVPGALRPGPGGPRRPVPGGLLGGGRGVVPGSRVTVDQLHLGPERIGFLHVLSRMGADVVLHDVGGDAARSPCRLPAGGHRRRGRRDPLARRGADPGRGRPGGRRADPLRRRRRAAGQGVGPPGRHGRPRAAFGGPGRGRGGRPGGGGGATPTPGRVDARGDHRMAMAAAVAAAACPAGARSSVAGWGRWPPATPGSPPPSTDWPGVRVSRVVTVAIDGPAGSGKSTLSRALAARLGIQRLDTGAMYRSVAWAALRRGVDPGDTDAVADVARTLVLEVGDTVVADGTDITEAIRGPEVSAAVSAVAANPAVRTVMVERQRAWVAEHGGGVVEGRDIGSVVLPDADLKLYLTASPEVRAARRAEEGAEAVARRDRLDSTRAVSPLGPGRRRPGHRHRDHGRRGDRGRGDGMAVTPPRRPAAPPTGPTAALRSTSRCGSTPASPPSTGCSGYSCTGSTGSPSAPRSTRRGWSRPRDR